MNEFASERRVSKFWLFLIFFALACICVVGVLLNRLWNALELYEESTPGAAIRGYVLAVKAGDFSDILKDSGFLPDPLNSNADYRSVVEGIFGAVEDLQHRRTSAPPSGGWEQYAILDGEREVGTVWVSQSPEAEDGRYKVRCDFPLFEGVTVTVPQHLEVYLNGLPLTPENAVIEELPLPLFASLPEEERPVRMRYTTGQTLYPQELSLKLPDGECILEEDVEAPGHFTGREVLSRETENAFAALIEEAAKAYAAYVTNDAEFSAVASFLLPGTEFYESLRTFDRSWYVPHTGYSIDKVAVTDIAAWSRDCFSGVIRFDYNIIAGRVYPYPTAYSMPFVRVGGEWKLLYVQTI
ncbi:MAG: hypothetical protein LBU86_05060 [Oscillospiraceae bacterium]|jgi:hypothetical protein|nr:hypothetical protein [Oscillospiraceae bacterium]